jgi:O-glycosyl hydrolase
MPIANVEPDAGLQVTVGFGSTASVAVAVNETGAPVELVAETAMLPGTLMVGGIVS